VSKLNIIAEAGVNHNGSIELALQLVDVAKEAGADAVKFQTFNAEKLVTRNAPKARYQTDNTGDDESQYHMLKKLELSTDDLRKIMTYCREKNILFLSTPFDEESADVLDKLGMNTFKIPSGEITNKFLLQHIAAKKKPIILSTGMSYLGEVEKAISWIKEIWDPINGDQELSLLHCVSSYPAAVEDINLYAMRTMRKAFRLPVGYSDHSTGIEISIAAVALGATIIEKHFTLKRTMEGPDHRASLEPDELKTMIQAIRNVEKAMGDGIKRPAINEQNTRDVARKSLVAIRPIQCGERIELSNIHIKRPGTGIPPEFKAVIYGMIATRDIAADSVIQWEDLHYA
jgi:N-acetylneuraminate synthase